MTEMNVPKKIPVKKIYTAAEFFKFTKNKETRHELIGGTIHMMASPSVTHQDICRKICRKLEDFSEGKSCRVFMAPLDVVLFEKDKTKKSKYTRDAAQNVFQPDVFVVCSPKKISENKINGAPDFIIEVVSTATALNDYVYKLKAYMEYGVCEYWIVNPVTKKVLVYTKNKETLETCEYTFEDTVKSAVLDGFETDFRLIK